MTTLGKTGMILSNYEPKSLEGTEGSMFDSEGNPNLSKETLTNRFQNHFNGLGGKDMMGLGYWFNTDILNPIYNCK